MKYTHYIILISRVKQNNYRKRKVEMVSIVHISIFFYGIEM